MRKFFSVLVLLVSSQVIAMGSRIPGNMNLESLEFKSRSTLLVVQDFSMPGINGKVLTFTKGQKIPVSLSLYSGIDTRAEDVVDLIQYSVTIKLPSEKSFEVNNQNLRVRTSSEKRDSSSRQVTQTCTVRDDVKACKDGRYDQCKEFSLERNGIQTVEMIDTIAETDYQITILKGGSVVAKISGQGIRRDTSSNTIVPCH